MVDAVEPGIKVVQLNDAAGADGLGLVTTSPGATTLLGRLKTLATSLTSILAALGNLAKGYAGEYETVAASQTAQVLGATGGIGDFISGVLIIPATTAPGVVTLLDGATSIPLWVGGTVGADLKPFWIDLNMVSVVGAWKITTGANVSVIGVGDFT